MKLLGGELEMGSGDVEPRDICCSLFDLKWHGFKPILSCDFSYIILEERIYITLQENKNEIE
jgi:hypothetical protein